MNARAPRVDRGRGPTRLGLLALALSGFALLATSARIPTLEGRVIGEVTLSGGESVERDLRIHVDPRAGGATRGSIRLSFQAASGLQIGFGRDVTIVLDGASDATGPFGAEEAIPVERCASGCDLIYRIRIGADPDVLPDSIVRYSVDVELDYDGGPSLSRDPSLMRLDLDGATSAPTVVLLSLLAGLLALVVGIWAGPRLDRAFRGRRLWPARALMLLGIGMGVAVMLVAVANLLRPNPYAEFRWSPELILAVVDPWTVGLLGTLVWGIRRGLRRWPADGGWVLGLAAVAMVGLGGLWLAFRSTAEAVVQPIGLAFPFVLLGCVGGVVIGQAWRTDPTARHDRWWAAFAVLGHGVVLAGFGFIAELSLYNPFGGTPWSLLAVIPLIFIGLAFHRWLGGRRPLLFAFDLTVAVIGLVGLRLWSSLGELSSQNPGPLDSGDVAVGLAVGAALVAFVTSFHEMPRAVQPGADVPGPAPVAPQVDTAAVSAPEPPDDVRSTT